MQMWFFMLFIAIVLPFIMFMSSFYFIAGGPKNINNIFGYRTGLSMINKDTWIFAHEYCGKLWLKVSLFWHQLLLCFALSKPTKEYLLLLDLLSLLLNL